MCLFCGPMTRGLWDRIPQTSKTPLAMQRIMFGHNCCPRYQSKTKSSLWHCTSRMYYMKRHTLSIAMIWLVTPRCAIHSRNRHRCRIPNDPALRFRAHNFSVRVHYLMLWHELQNPSHNRNLGCSHLVSRPTVCICRTRAQRCRSLHRQAH